MCLNSHEFSYEAFVSFCHEGIFMKTWPRVLGTAVALLIGAALVFTGRPAAAQELLKVTDKLTADDPADKVKKNSKSKVHPFKMEAGKGYKIELHSKAFDSFLRLENPEGQQVGLDDDGAGFPNSRLIHVADKAGEYRIIVTTFGAGETGEYTLTVMAASKADMLASRVAQIGKLGPAEKKEVLDELKKQFTDKGKDLGQQDAQLAFKLALALEQTRDPAAGDVYQEFGKLLATASDDKVAGLGKQFEGAARRVKLPGNPIVVKGNKLDGKPFDWNAYKGKVVLVDFWATWCGPCVAEMPNIKKAYETYHDRGFEVVGISLDSKKDLPAKFMQDRNLPWTCVFDGKGADSLADYYGIFFIPQAILVDRDGNVVSMNARGPELDRLLEKLIGPAEKEKK
jgi:thiol-disulfide isomerase/thioredoxin